MTLADGLTWFVWGGMAVTVVIGWVRAVEWATLAGVARFTLWLTSCLLMWAALWLIIELDIAAKMIP